MKRLLELPVGSFSPEQLIAIVNDTTPQTAATRKAAERSRRRAAGLVRVEAWIRTEDLPAFRALLESLSRKRDLHRVLDRVAVLSGQLSTA
jgi:hypothetical protein